MPFDVAVNSLRFAARHRGPVREWREEVQIEAVFHECPAAVATFEAIVIEPADLPGPMST